MGPLASMYIRDVAGSRDAARNASDTDCRGLKSRTHGGIRSRLSHEKHDTESNVSIAMASESAVRNTWNPNDSIRLFFLTTTFVSVCNLTCRSRTGKSEAADVVGDPGRIVGEMLVDRSQGRIEVAIVLSVHDTEEHENVATVEVQN